jgi:hypothetical protein
METIKITRLEQSVLEDLASGFSPHLIRASSGFVDKNGKHQKGKYYNLLAGLRSKVRFNAKNNTHLVSKYKDLKSLGKIEVLEEVVDDAS